MLSEKQINEIREYLEQAQNPVFFFDNDNDGLISFILLRRYIGRGKGIAIKSFPALEDSYVKKIDEFGSDYVFVLDKHAISDGFFEECKKRNVPVIWIDHHEVEIENLPDFVKYYNSFPNGEPVSYIAHKITKKDDWLAMVGCISDNFLPDFAKDFEKKYPEIWKKNPVSAFEILYDSEFGKMVRMLDYGLKDRTTNVVYMINFLFNVNSPFDLLKEDEKNIKIYQRYNKLKTIYEKLLTKAKSVARKQSKIIFFQYGGEFSLSADISNELSYHFPGKVVIVAFIKGSTANVSVRGNVDVREITLKAIEGLTGATGGGHKFATGARINVSDLDYFKKFFIDSI